MEGSCFVRPDLWRVRIPREQKQNQLPGAMSGDPLIVEGA